MPTDAPQARLASGTVRGRFESGVAVFRGIPYAEPPARFAAPGPAVGWDGVRDATAYGPAPPQSGLLGTHPGTGTAAEGGWLTANVWTPDPAARLPVMVWIQGGGYLLGTSGLPEYDGARLAGEGGVVVVTFNYRVGVEGFALVDGGPVNRGLLDQVAALTWVRDHAGAFGGDADRVTVFGESAGAGSVAALLAMPSAGGLFHRAVVQSMPGVFLSPELAADVTAVLAARLGLATPAALTELPSDRLPVAADALMGDLDRYAARWGQAAHGKVPFGPVVDGDTLPTDPWQALRGGAAGEVDLLVGHVRHEQRLFSLMDGLLGQVTAAQAERALDLFAPRPDGAARYRSSGETPEALHERVLSDWRFRMPSLHLAEAHTGRTHVYELTWPAPAMGGALGACHGLDVPLVFGNLTEGQPAMLLADGLDEAEVVSARMRTAWTAFAADGDPGWPAYGEERLTRVFDVEPTVAPYPEEDSRGIWEDHVFSVLPLLPA